MQTMNLGIRVGDFIQTGPRRPLPKTEIVVRMVPRKNGFGSFLEFSSRNHINQCLLNGATFFNSQTISFQDSVLIDLPHPNSSNRTESIPFPRTVSKYKALGTNSKLGPTSTNSRPQITYCPLSADGREEHPRNLRSQKIDF